MHVRRGKVSSSFITLRRSLGTDKVIEDGFVFLSFPSTCYRDITNFSVFYFSMDQNTTTSLSFNTFSKHASTSYLFAFLARPTFREQPKVEHPLSKNANSTLSTTTNKLDCFIKMSSDLIARMFTYFFLVILENVNAFYLDIISVVERMVPYEGFLDVSSRSRALVISCSQIWLLTWHGIVYHEKYTRGHWPCHLYRLSMQQEASA